MFFGNPRGGWYPQKPWSKYLCPKDLPTEKNTGILAWAIQKIVFFGVHFERDPGGVVAPNYVRIFASKLLLMSKYTGTINQVIKKFGFWGSILGGPWGWHPKLCQNICRLNIC